MAAASSSLSPAEAAVAEACAKVLRVAVEQLRERERSLLELGLSSLGAAMLHRELLQRGVKGIKSAATVLHAAPLTLRWQRRKQPTTELDLVLC